MQLCAITLHHHLTPVDQSKLFISVKEVFIAKIKKIAEPTKKVILEILLHQLTP
jgi:hypothetical protein